MNEKLIKNRFDLLSPHLDERLLRLYAATEAAAIGYGGTSKVSRITGISRPTIISGIKELNEKSTIKKVAVPKIRNAGGGRKRTVDRNPQLLIDLEKLIEPVTRGDPESSLRWTCKSVRKLAQELTTMGHKTSHRMVAEMLRSLNYSLQANQKTLEGTSHPDRNQQFEYIYDNVSQFQLDSQPVISVDTKKKELVGNYKNNGKELRPRGTPEKVHVHDFPDKELGKVAPYGIYDQTTNTGWVNLGTDHDTAAFAVESIRQWWQHMGKQVYPEAKRLLITADSGGSNGSRVKLWKTEIQKFANETKLEITICHFPPGTSKWNKVEHRLFSYISQNWRGKPLISHEVIINLISSTKTSKGLKVECRLDKKKYPKGIKVSDREMKKLNIARHEFHGEWNYTIKPENKNIL